MNENYKVQAKEWFERGRKDIEMAQLIYDERGYAETCAFLTQQAVEKCFKGFIVASGREPPRTHDLERLLTEVSEIDPQFSKYTEVSAKMTRYYIEGRYPPGPIAEYSWEETRAILDDAWEIIRQIERGMEGRENRAQGSHPGPYQ
jgi:HEPN domain-containing protein